MIVHDPDYDLVEYHSSKKKGQQCGKCGMKFDYDISYRYWCANDDCPMGYGSYAYYSASDSSGC